MTKKSAWRVGPDQRHLLVIGACSFSALISMTLCVGLMANMLAYPDARTSIFVQAAFGTGALALLLELFVTIYGRHELHSRADLFDDARTAKTQTDELFAMTDMLQSADDHDDAAAVLMTTSLRLLPDFGATLYIFNNSRDRLDLAGSWGLPEDYQAPESLAPSNCWALKRGKAHINDPARGTLCCAHHGGMAATLEMPMMARGSVYGLLMFASREEQPGDVLPGISRLCQALADSMSLALSNISLREKLRTQSLRDPLTGLYNRRYMEDTLERFVSLAERSSGSTALLMLDLDNFKRLNDEHGHAKGDAVLRDVGAQLIGGLRPSDVVCRYGGEELVVILPNCLLDDAKLKAEMLRLRIESLTEAHGVPISASIGVAAIPETSASKADLLPMADAALYGAKGMGKNCVVCASRRPGRDDGPPRLVATV